MATTRGKHKPSTIFSKIFRPVFSVMFLVIGLYSLLLSQNVLGYLKTNAAAVFEERVVNRKLYIENEINDWRTALNTGAEQIIPRIEALVAENGADVGQIKTDSQLNQELLWGVMDDVLGTLRTSGATELFLVLDGPAPGQAQSKAGIYLRNSNPSFYSASNQSLLLERGLSTLSKEWKIPLDSFWEAGFYIDPQSSDCDFYTKPLEAAQASDNLDYKNFAYWSFGHPIDLADKGVLTYSVPLIATNGTVIGVMGVGVDEDHFARTMDYKELGGERTGAYMLAKTQDGATYQPVIFNGASYNKHSFLSQTVQITPQKPVYKLQLPDSATALCTSVQPFSLYNSNTPFEQEKWALLGVQTEKELFYTYTTAQRMLIIMAVSSILCGLLSAYWASRQVSSPIRRLVEGLRKSDPNRPIHLQRLEVEEIDELERSIEGLSRRVAAAFSRISTIIQLSESGIGVFEYKEKENLVFCSQGLYDLLGWPGENLPSAYVDGSDFSARLAELKKRQVPGEENLYELALGAGGVRWVKLNQTQEDGSLLGVVTDVTAEVLEKRQIKYERDYDILTSIYNRRAFEDRVRQLMAQPGQMGLAALIVWDLDNLKYVNDAYGHTTGDAYIIAMAESLRRFLGAECISARRSGDEFITLLYGYGRKEDISAVVGQVWQSAQAAAITLPNGKPYKMRVSAGLAWYPNDAADYTTLFQYADFAMYTAKHQHKGTLEIFAKELYNTNRILLQGQEEFNNLLDNHLVYYVLQPIVTVETGQVYGYEMLMRSELELFRSPADILRMGHAQSRLYDLEVMTWFEAMKSFVHLSEYGMLEPNAKVFINSIANQMLTPEMQALFQKTFQQYLPRLVCELTEEDQRDALVTEQKAELMRGWNAMVAIDDYGCGYNSEAILLETAPNIVKIDMNIVRDIHTDENRQRLVKNLVLYARERGIQVLGEGVESEEEVRTLIELGVELLQGFYVARPSFYGASPLPEVCERIVEMKRRAQAAE